MPANLCKSCWGVRLTHTLKNLTVRGAGPKRVLVPFLLPEKISVCKAYHLYMSLGILRWPPYDLFERDQQPQPLLGSTKVRRPVILCPGRQITNRYVVLQQLQCSYVGQLSIGCQDQSRQVGHCRPFRFLRISSLLGPKDQPLKVKPYAN